ncbi:1358_t:CDS:2 [Dentiscutata erythropus]|uniref:1358_t:CDS:1 n=1 Tax=Dentiscutata erythropus TaxID=1348616 RepID=A0A9N8WF75_9GLOM|nr:1358_t:CDS:2 [Dentiscutata erythropus]
MTPTISSDKEKQRNTILDDSNDTGMDNSNDETSNKETPYWITLTTLEWITPTTSPQSKRQKKYQLNNSNDKTPEWMTSTMSSDKEKETERLKILIL